MKYFLAAIFFLISFPNGFGQMPTPSPASKPDQASIKKFGSSIENIGRKGKNAPKTRSKSKPGEADEVINVKTDLVVNDVLVTDQKNNIIAGLKKEDFVVTEDNAPQTIEIFSISGNGSIPRSVVLILDRQTPQEPYLKNSLAAAKLLVDKLNPGDKMAIVTIDLNLRIDFTSDKNLLKSTLDSLEKPDPKIWGGLQFDTLLAALNEMFYDSDRQKIVILQGSGTQAIWLKPDKDTPYKVSYPTLEKNGLRYSRYIPKFGFSEIKEAIEKSRVTIYSIIPGIRFLGLSKEEQLERAKSVIQDMNAYYGWNKEKDLPAIINYYQGARAEANIAGQTAMFKVAEWSGGNAGFMEKPEDAENVYSDIFKIINNRYVIGYYPTNQNRDGKLRQVKLEVRSHPEYTVTGRKAYFAPE